VDAAGGEDLGLVGLDDAAALLLLRLEVAAKEDTRGCQEQG